MRGRLVLAGCVGQVPPSASDTALVPTQTTLPNCREFTAQVTVEGQPRQAVGQTCQQPDGSWQALRQAAIGELSRDLSDKLDG
jgi:hypothetical protein